MVVAGERYKTFKMLYCLIKPAQFPVLLGERVAPKSNVYLHVL